MYIWISTGCVLLGVVLDLMFGDPNVWWHPICLIGRLISKTEKRLRKNAEGEKAERHAGLCLVVTVCLISTLIPAALLVIAWQIHWFVYAILETIFAWFILAARSLRTESMKVYTALEKDGLDAGRTAVSMIVGRDTKALTEEGVIKAAVETVAENTSDGVIAPLFYMMIGGAALGFLYKSINTMDSMVGYKNEKYIHFGRCAAKLDDIANYIPSRLSAVFMILSSAICGFSAGNAFRIFKRDHRKHASPNAAQTESVMAGALGVRLAGNAFYFGKLYEKEYIGDGLRDIEREDIRRANRLMIGTTLTGTLIFMILKGLVMICISMAGIYTII